MQKTILNWVCNVCSRNYFGEFLLKGSLLENQCQRYILWRKKLEFLSSDPSPIISNLVTRTSAQKLQYWLTHFSALRKLVETWMIWPLLRGIPNQTVTHMLWRGCVICELLKAVKAFGNVLFITNVQICFWQKKSITDSQKKKVGFEVKKSSAAEASCFSTVLWNIYGRK